MLTLQKALISGKDADKTISSQKDNDDRRKSNQETGVSLNNNSITGQPPQNKGKRWTCFWRAAET